jgi:hypothetical protein
MKKIVLLAILASTSVLGLAPAEACYRETWACVKPNPRHGPCLQYGWVCTSDQPPAGAGAGGGVGSPCAWGNQTRDQNGNCGRGRPYLR